jgi:hypothetical protein
MPSKRKNEVAELDELGKSTTTRNLSAAIGESGQKRVSATAANPLV